MISYKPNIHDEGTYVLSYTSLREDYRRYAAMGDAEFVASAVKVLHCACVILFLKEAGSDYTLGDDGIIHELVHLLDPDTRSEAVKRLPAIRDLFNRDCCLA